MDDDLDLRDFENRCRLFPLPDLVFFPHNVLPLHLFEPRYRQMMEDALAGDRLVTMARLRPPTLAGSGGFGTPPIDDVACLGRIIQHERTPDGRYFCLLLGRKRVRLIRELPSDRLYRIAEAVILEDPNPTESEATRTELIRLFRAALERQGPLDADLAGLLENLVPLDILTDIVANALSLPFQVKQSLLAEADAGRRAESLLSILRKAPGLAETSPKRDRTFPPPFSRN